MGGKPLRECGGVRMDYIKSTYACDVQHHAFTSYLDFPLWTAETNLSCVGPSRSKGLIRIKL